MKLDFRLFNIILFSVFIGLSLLALFTSYQIQPLTGDLTRIDWRSEQQFGWNQKESGFPKPLVVENWSENRPPVHDKYYDVVVLGDSFSNPDQQAQTPGGAYWQNWFVQQTGLSLINFDLNTLSIEELLNSEGFKNHPPRFFIVESVERFLDARMIEFNNPELCSSVVLGPENQAMGISPENHETVERSRETGRAEFGYAFNYVLKQVKFLLWGERMNTQLVDLEPAHQSLSHGNKNQLLVVEADIRAPWSSETVNAASCGATALSNRVQANSATSFILLVAPDKTTVYNQYAVDPAINKISQLERLLEQTQILSPRIDLALKEAVSPAQNIKDIYLPNDTHWGSRGHRLAAETLTAYLQKEGLVTLK